MSRRPPNPAAERAAQNQQTIKSLLKLEANKVCADCKKNKHPRWASWNLGIFICIRCSGIHRGMGTHISRVKSVDLDAWTDEQLQSILSWGNARANKYWEAKLAAGHTPSEAKIENFIRTKYELKRWCMEGPRPDPATLDVDGDDDMPLSIVKEKQNIERKESIRKASVGKSAAPTRIAAPIGDLIGGDDPIPRASTAGPTATQVPPKASPAPPKSTSAKDSLFGLDFLGTEPAAPPRPASTTGSSTSGAQSRPDLKQSILSLYATAPRPQAQQQPSHGASGSFSSMQSPTMSPPQSSSSGLHDAFSSLSFSSGPTPKSPQNDAFSGLGSFSSTSSRPAAQSNTSALSGLGGGGFFDNKPKPAPTTTHQKQPSFGGFGDFASPTISAPAPKPAAAPASSAMADLFDFSTPASPPAPQPSNLPPAMTDSVFNLSQPKSPPAPSVPAANPMASAGNAWSNSDIWGSNAWSAPEPASTVPAPVTSPELPKTSALSGMTDNAWGSSGSSFANTNSFANTSIVPGQTVGFNPLSAAPAPPKVAADEEFGGWTTGPTATSSSSNSKPAGGFGGNDDLFSNVWQ